MKDSLSALLVGAVVFALALGLLFYERSASDGSSLRAGKPAIAKSTQPRSC